MKLPAYPLFTIDPFTTIWSGSDRLDGSDTNHWSGRKMPVRSFVRVDNVTYRLMGKGFGHTIDNQTVEVSPFKTEYVFKANGFTVKLLFISPMRADVTETLAYPFSYMDYDFTSEDGKVHDVGFSLYVDEKVSYNKHRPVCTETQSTQNVSIISVGLNNQRPLSEEGDALKINWGRAYLAVLEPGKTSVKKNVCGFGISVSSDFTGVKNASGTFVFGYDDIESIDYFDNHLKGYWHEKFDNIVDALVFAVKEHDSLIAGAKEFSDRLIADAAEFGSDYQAILSAAYRQVVAAHKLVRDPEGNLLYLSKECNSNGCMNTVDVSYPSIPLLCLYNPQLLTGYMTAIFKFAVMPCWKFDFSPHDIGTYPRASGQTYGLPDKLYKLNHNGVKKVYTYETNLYDEKGQQPVEECGNMLIMCYVYYSLTKDSDYIAKYFDLLTKWCDYLVEKGVILTNQLCTDDFAGHLEKNVNLAIKSVMGIQAYSFLCRTFAPDKAESYHDIAVKNAKEIEEKGNAGDRLPLAFDTENTWSLKYNMVWDVIWNTKLFCDQTVKNEIEFYKTRRNEFGIPLDSRSEYTKSDWIMWAASLDESGELAKEFARDMVNYLQNAYPRRPFGDWYYTVSKKKNPLLKKRVAWSIMFAHRSVQGGLWMPVFAKKESEKYKKISE